jgi:hypothetical protein
MTLSFERKAPSTCGSPDFSCSDYVHYSKIGHFSGASAATEGTIDALPLRTDAGHVPIAVGAAQQIIAALNGAAGHGGIQLASRQTRFPPSIDQELIMGIKAHR